MYLALIKNNLVEAIIVADSDFISHIEEKYDLILDVTDNRPNVGDSYYPDTGTFVSNNLILNQIPVDLTASHLQNGTENGFEPFSISKYLVSYKDGIVTIGCKQYPAAGLLDTLHNLLIEKKKTTTLFTSLVTGPTHGKFDVTWEDARKIYEMLSKVKI